VGSLYAAADPRRDRAYTIFYVGFKIGAFLAPLVCGTLAEEWGWHYGFAAAGAGMAIGLAVYLYAGSALPPDEMDKIPAPLLRERQEAAWQSILALSVLFIPAALFWAAYQQRGNTIALWADDYTDRTINLLIWHGEIPVAWFQAFNPLLLFAFAPVVIGLWSRQARRGSEPSTIAKMALGAVCVALAYLVMAGAAWSAAGDEASWWWLAAFFALLTVGELYFAPISFSLVSKAVPGRMLSTTMGLWLATSFAGSLLSGWLGSFWSDMNKASFFLMLSGVAAFAGLLIYAFKRPLRSMLGD
jgi:POT family proton-dependent oligopeptide transporter